MSDWQRPAWLSEALDAREMTPVAFSDSQGPRKVGLGEIRAARPMDGAGPSRLVLILGASDPGWANAMLLTNEVEAATNRDVRLDPGDTRLTFPVLAETDIVGPVFVVQCGPLLGRVSEELIEQLQKVKRGDDSYVLADRRGLPVLSRKEHRVRWKEEELRAFHELAGDCFAELMLKEGERAPVLADPAFFDDLEDAGPVEIVTQLLELAKVEHLDVPPEKLREPEGLKSWFAQLDPGQMAALEPIWRGALRDTGSLREGADPGEWEPARGGESEILERSVARRVARGERNIPIATKTIYWEGEEHEGIVKVRLRDGSVVQLSPIFLEGVAA